ncbi:DUF1176 domain-containing protein [Martelella sp. AMO21009]
MKMRSLVYAGLAASVVGVLSLQTTASAAEVLNTGATWNAACDAAMTCRLTTSDLPANDGGLAIPSFVRTSGAKAPVMMVLPTIDGWDTLAKDGKFTISVDGEEVSSIKVSQLKQDDAEGGYVTTDPKIVQPVLAAAKVGEDEIMVTYEGPETQEVATADLTGFRESLEWLAQQQHRGS